MSTQLPMINTPTPLFSVVEALYSKAANNRLIGGLGSMGTEREATKVFGCKWCGAWTSYLPSYGDLP